MTKAELKEHRKLLEQGMKEEHLKAPEHLDFQNLYLLSEAIYQRHGRHVLMKSLLNLCGAFGKSPDKSPEQNLVDNFKELSE